MSALAAAAPTWPTPIIAIRGLVLVFPGAIFDDQLLLALSGEMLLPVLLYHFVQYVGGMT